MTFGGLPRERRGAKYEGLYAQRSCGLIEPHAQLVSPRCEDFLYLIKVGRNERCPCGSGLKYKHCHGGPLRPET